EVIDGLEGFALADVQLADGHQGDLVARFILQNVLVFGDGLDDFALIQQLLCGFDVFAFGVSHSRKETNPPRERSPTHSPGWPRAENGPRSYSGNASRREKGKSTNPKFVVSRQLSPCCLGTTKANTWRTKKGRRLAGGQSFVQE